jgi:hypothetical protein
MREGYPLALTRWERVLLVRERFFEWRELERERRPKLMRQSLEERRTKGAVDLWVHGHGP